MSDETHIKGRAGIRLTRRDRLAAWVVTGPLGRLLAFVIDLAAAWWNWARRRAG